MHDLRALYADCLPRPEIDAARALCVEQRATMVRMLAEVARRQAMGVTTEHRAGATAQQRQETDQLVEWLAVMERLALGIRGLEAHIAALGSG